MKTAELVKKCQDRMRSIRDKIETKRKSKKVYSEEEVLEFANWLKQSLTAKQFYSTDTEYLLEQFKKK